MEKRFQNPLSATFETEVQQRLVRALSDAFAGAVDIHEARAEARQLKEGGQILKLVMGDESVDILVHVLRNAYPRDIRQALWSLGVSASSADFARRPIMLVAAESLSPGAKEELKKQGVAFFEMSGTLYLHSGRWLINIERMTKKPPKKDRVKLFSGARESVVHALLVHPYQWFSGAELAKLAETSPYTCSIVLQELERMEWCETLGAGPLKRRRLVQPALLLDAWAAQWVTLERKESRWYTFVEKPDRMLLQLASKLAQEDVQFPWLYSGAGAANIYSPFLTGIDTAEIIVPVDCAQSAAALLDLIPAPRGANVVLKERDAASMLFGTSLNGGEVNLASPIILYLDLLDGRGRNKEMAEHIREVLEKEWAGK
jgi:hypothetical protein